MMQRLNLLFITPYLPDEQAGMAGAQLMWRVITGLAERHRVIVISYRYPDDDLQPPLKRGITLHTIEYARHYGSWWSAPKHLLLKRLLTLFTSLIHLRPYELEKYHSRPMQRLISRIVAKEPVDIIQCEYNLMALNLPSGLTIPTLLVEHDVSTKPYERYKTSSRSAMMRLTGYFQSWLWRRSEPKLCNRFSKVVTLTPEDQTDLIDLGVQVPIEVIPPPVNVQINQGQSKTGDVCFVGSFNRAPNRETLEELLTDIWPIIRCQRPDSTLRIAGKYLTGKLLLQARSASQVSYAGFVTDIDRFIADCSLLLAPIQLGGGLKMKITHALACGTPVITTSTGAEGIDITPDEGLLITDSPEEMAQLALDLLNSPEKAKRLSTAAARAAKNKFSTATVLKTYETIYKNLLIPG